MDADPWCGDHPFSSTALGRESRRADSAPCAARQIRDETLGFIGVVVGFLAGSGATASMSGQAGALLVAAVGTVTVLLARFVPRPLDCHTDATLARTYRTRFFLRLAFAQGAAQCGFVAFFLAANPAMYPLGLAFAACEHVVLAPTAARLAAEQHRLNISGCGRSLALALRFGFLEGPDGPGTTPTQPSGVNDGLTRQ